MYFKWESTKRKYIAVNMAQKESKYQHIASNVEIITRQMSYALLPYLINSSKKNI